MHLASGLPAEAGSMGVHFAHPGLLGITAMEPRATGTDAAIDWTRPEVLLYEPQPDGTLELTGVECLVFESAWKGAGNAEPPSFHGTPFPYMIDDPATELDERTPSSPPTSSISGRCAKTRRASQPSSTPP